jgi:hypothetical protein
MADRSAALRRVVGEPWPAAQQFFERAAREFAAPDGLGFRAAYASVPRRLATLAEARVTAPPELEPTRPHWTLTDYARAALIASCFDGLAPERRASVHLTLFEAGELGEQVSLLRTLSLLPEPARFLETALQGCRTNALSVFEAVVCDNPYVAEHFPALNFNQAVLKAVFMGLSARRIEGLEQRITPELARMAAGYKSERLAAGRSVPVDIEYLIQHGG